jgi:heme-degrading monooxygenase HmoA
MLYPTSAANLVSSPSPLKRFKMFAYILRVKAPPSEEADEFFRRFKETPGLLYAYNLQGAEDPDDGVAIAIWESRDAAERYLSASQLRQQVDEAMPTVTRTMYEVRDSK